MKKPRELRKSFFDSAETCASKDFWWLVIQVESEKKCDTLSKDSTPSWESGKLLRTKRKA